MRNQCELCEDVYSALGDEDDKVNFESIKETGRCQDCFEEFGDQYPDRI
jgi:hypothetical protein